MIIELSIYIIICYAVNTDTKQFIFKCKLVKTQIQSHYPEDYETNHFQYDLLFAVL